MAKYKYMMVEDAAGNIITRGDKVWAYVHGVDGKRTLLPAKVEKINANTIGVMYELNNVAYRGNVNIRMFGKMDVANDPFEPKEI